MTVAKGNKLVLLRKGRIVLIELMLRDQSVKRAALGGIAHLHRRHCHKGYVGLELTEALGCHIGQRIVAVIPQQGRDEEVETGAAGKRVGVAHHQVSLTRCLGEGLEVCLSILVHQLVVVVLAQQEACHIAHRALAHIVTCDALGCQHVDPQAVGGGVAIRNSLARGNVVVAKTTRHVAYLDRNATAINLIPCGIELLGKLAHPAVGALARLFGRAPDLCI